VRGGEEVAVLGPGDFFGELSVLDGLPRVAQVVAIEPTRCLALATWEFEQVLLEFPTLAVAILRGLATRLRSVTEQQNL
jgi:CRP-like cAMP-binding protein